MSAARPSPGGAPRALVRIARDLSRAIGGLTFGPPVTHVYNPLDYAWEPHRRYLERYGDGRRRALLLGMNPGPFGMAQTGVPFGDVVLVRDWLGITGHVRRPQNEHPRRPVLGFDCPRREISGSRLWGWARDTFGEPERFFEDFFVHNYCPLSFMESSGRNRTPDHLPRDEREALFAICDKALARVVDCLEPDRLVGIGRFAESRARIVAAGGALKVGHLPHPSPASPAANRDWARRATRALGRAGRRASLSHGS